LYDDKQCAKSINSIGSALMADFDLHLGIFNEFMNIYQHAFKISTK
jgi:hypothetical protein